MTQIELLKNKNKKGIHIDSERESISYCSALSISIPHDGGLLHIFIGTYILYKK